LQKNCRVLIAEIPRLASIVLAGISSAQVFLGFATFLMLLLISGEQSASEFVFGITWPMGALKLAGRKQSFFGDSGGAVDMRSQTGH